MMKIAILIVIVLITLISTVLYLKLSIKKKRNESVIFKSDIIYIGGYDGIDQDKDCNFVVYCNKLCLSIDENIEKVYDLVDIKECKIIKKDELIEALDKKQITLLNKIDCDKLIENRYILFNIEEKEEKTTIIFTASYPEFIVSAIHGVMEEEI
ncbi:hypothetical protein U732_2032 [Clostridium argentinense CDC 2741]|uniref:Uncharacterized protein n=1 Tax=Clostridium argentinense CDC 2741 TaxID=1418104 RepID=A0A0C1U455_9CLOT|nr:hypothetical protein [Clostridium argentinense]ARC85770.1 hypothetical protein RSJ17_15365 [Clostridium argentinense]KIE46318.1 hypothetical protein U732_2032 [Clostridium argentinense CDC 2741]NFF39852.1 hypothetical protein [Clostridium argentinense]NFP51045.1 hypothetical protein [Clostridium argentinense]NFP73177.1 hypothetical protein [Clostridium argentinense]